MSKKSRRRSSRGNTAPTKLSPEAIERKAQEDLARGHHREAIEGFKQLFKQEPRPAWRSALADAYAGRARELTAKGMLKEALVIWEIRANLGEDIPFEADQAELLLRMGRVDSMPTLVSRVAEVSPAQRDRLRSLLAAAYLAGEDAVASRLPPDDPVALHGKFARAALTAYCTGDDQVLHASLAAIPFRSPYRDWVQILKALQRLPESPEEAADLLSRVGDGSAFCHLRRAAQLALLPQAPFLEAIRSAGTRSVRFACVLRGWPQARIALWEELSRLGAEPRSETLLRLMVRHRDALGTNWVRRRGLRLLVEGYPTSRRLLKAAGAPPLSTEESLLLAAWNAERSGDLWEEQDRWDNYARHLIQELSGNEQEADHKLRIALVLRRCDQVGDVLSQATPSTDLFDIDQDIAEQVEESLTWDPDDPDTYLRLIGYYRRGKRLKDTRRLLKLAKERWPKDMRVLEAELDTTLESGAFKKAAGLAREILALDGINSGVRERLVKAHLAHARKQVVRGRLDLARKELAQAGDWARSAHARDRIDLTAGLITLMEDANRGTILLRELVAHAGGGLAGHLTLALAAEALDISLKKLFERMGIQMPSVAGRDDLLATLARLRRHLDAGSVGMTRELHSYLSKALAKAPWSSLSKSETETACDTLLRCRLHQTRLNLSRAALKRWRGEPLFELHAFEAKYPEEPRDCSDKDIDRLEGALERARKEGDTRIAMRIDEMLADLDPFPFGPMSFEPQPPSGPADQMLDAESLTTVIETLGLENTLNALGLPPEMKRDLKKLAREQGEEAVVHSLAAFLEMVSGFAEGKIDLPFGGPPTGKPPAPKRWRPRPKPSPDKGQDDDPLEQLDLF